VLLLCSAGVRLFDAGTPPTDEGGRAGSPHHWHFRSLLALSIGILRVAQSGGEGGQWWAIKRRDGGAALVPCRAGTTAGYYVDLFGFRRTTREEFVELWRAGRGAALDDPAALQVRKTPSWPGSWANFSLF
jgi:hypothetical protein